MNARVESLPPGWALAGVDLGGTKIAVCVADASGVRARRRVPVPLTGDEFTIARTITELVLACCSDAGLAPSSLSAVGVSACGPFVGEPGHLASAAPNLCGGLSKGALLPNRWTRVPIEAPLRQAFGEVVLTNDAQAALLAEHRFGALQGVADCAYLTWSTGIGVGLMLDGRLLRGKSGNAGHAGHSVVPSEATDAGRCACGNESDVESIAGGAALAQRWGADTQSLFAACRQGDPAARARVDRAIDAVADLIYNLIVTLDLGRVAIGGGLFCAQADLLLPALRERVFESARRPGMRGMLTGVRIEPIEDPGRTSELGALALVAPVGWQPAQQSSVIAA